MVVSPSVSTRLSFIVSRTAALGARIRGATAWRLPSEHLSRASEAEHALADFHGQDFGDILNGRFLSERETAKDISLEAFPKLAQPIHSYFTLALRAGWGARSRAVCNRRWRASSARPSVSKPAWGRLRRRILATHRIVSNRRSARAWQQCTNGWAVQGN